VESSGGGRIVTSVGSGTLIDNERGLVITCKHLFDDGYERIICTFPNGKRYAALLTHTAPHADLAMLRIKSPGIETLPIDASEQTGTLTAGGFGPNGQFVAATGQVVRSDGGATSINAPVRQGDSGGGVINANRQFVGVVWGCDEHGNSFMTCGTPLARFLDSVFPYRTGAIVPRATPIARRSGGSVGRPPLEPIQPIPTTEPDPGPEIDYEAWEQWQEEIRQQQAQTQQQLQSLMIKIDGIKGEPGPAGPQGPPGPAGISPQIDYDELAEAVAARLTHSATITLLDGTRKTQTRPLNEPLEFIQHSRAKTPE
jgi:hypothetical protein